MNKTKISKKNVLFPFGDLSYLQYLALTANLRAQIDRGDPGLSFGYLTILLASIVMEIIAIFCENSPILRKFDLF